MGVPCAIQVLIYCVDIFVVHGEFSRAADLFAQANLFEKAADNFVLAGRPNDGASILARGNKFDSLVIYLDKYAIESISDGAPEGNSADSC